MKKITDPDEAIAEIEKARKLLWETYQDNELFDDGEMVEPVRALDKLLRNQQDRWEARKPKSEELKPKKSHKQKCTWCDGTGNWTGFEDNDLYSEPCEQCNGTGYVQKEQS